MHDETALETLVFGRFFVCSIHHYLLLYTHCTPTNDTPKDGRRDASM